MGWRRPLGAILLAICLPACSSKPYLNEPLARWNPEHDQQLGRRIAGDRDPTLLVLLAFSGGGVRAAALAYGVMQELSTTEIQTGQGTRRLLEEVDIISSVSGGSFVSAYYGLFGDRLFEDFETRFLRRNLERELVHGLLKPNHWKAMGSRYYGRSDMAATLYDNTIFEHATFADLARSDAPLVIINSTDIGTGIRVGFTSNHFDPICTNLEKFPVSRAVAASSAVPGIATPIAIKNYAGQCAYQLPHWLWKTPEGSPDDTGNIATQDMLGYIDADERPWLHLVDGGISDNLGLRPFYAPFKLETDPARIFQSFRHGNVSQILIIAVNATLERERPWSRSDEIPSATQVLTSVSSIQMGRYNSETIRVIQDSYNHWAQTMSARGQEVSFHFVEIGFASLGDPEERKYLNAIPSNFNLPDEQIDRLISTGRETLKSAQGFRRFLEHNRPAQPSP